MARFLSLIEEVGVRAHLWIRATSTELRTQNEDSYVSAARNFRGQLVVRV